MSWWLGVAVSGCLVLGYALDSADGQVARLTGSGGPAGEWLDHMVDAVKVVALPLALAMGAYRFDAQPRWWLVVPLVNAVASSALFFGMMLTEQLRRQHGVRSVAATGGPAPWLRSVLVLPTDYGVMCLSFLLLGATTVFGLLYVALTAALLAFSAAAAGAWFRQMGRLRRPAARNDARAPAAGAYRGGGGPMTLHEYAGAVARHWVVILVVALVGGLGALPLLTHASPPSTGRRRRSSHPRDGRHGQRPRAGLGLRAEPRPVVRRARLVTLRPRQGGGDDGSRPGDPLPGHVAVDTPLNTVVIEVSITDSTPQRARDFANGVVAQLAASVEQLSPQGSQKTAAVRLTTISPASLPVAPFSPNTRLNTALGVLAGLVLGVAYALARRLRGRRLVDADALLDDMGAPVIGEIFQADRGVGVSTTLALLPTSPVVGVVPRARRQPRPGARRRSAQGAARHVRTGGRGQELGGPRTRHDPGRVRGARPRGRRRPPPAEHGRDDAARGGRRRHHGPAGRHRSSPTPSSRGGRRASTSWPVASSRRSPRHLLASARFRGLLAEARERYNVILVDTPPVLNLSDSLWLAPLVDGTVVVARVGRTRSRDLAATVTALENTHTPVLGVVANGIEDGERSDYYAYSKPRARVRPGLRHRRSGSTVGASPDGRAPMTALWASPRQGRDAGAGPGLRRADDAPRRLGDAGTGAFARLHACSRRSRRCSSSSTSAAAPPS